MLDRARIVLVRPQRAGNVGAVCRAMRNFGLSDLALVQPDCDIHDEEAVGFAMRARDLLDAARVTDELAAAVGDCARVYATSAKGGFYRKRAAVTPAEAAREIGGFTGNERVAILFGPEDRGLTLDDLHHVDRVIEIPANPDYSALNLAAAAAVICYELRQVALAIGQAPPPNRDDPPTKGVEPQPLATAERKERLFAMLFDALEDLGYFRTQQSPHHLRLAIRHMLGRLDMTENEADVLIGMARQMRWYLDRHGGGGTNA